MAKKTETESIDTNEVKASKRITLSQYGEATYEVKKSVFLGYAKPVSSPEEANAFVDEIKHKNADARHNVYAWILKKEINLQKYSDDGEPSGTAGLPVLSVLTKNEITDAVVVVTRYFGGILLGKGGLVRAYTRAAAEAVKNAMPVTMELCVIYGIEVDYKNSERLLFEIRNSGRRITNIEYGANVSFEVIVPVQDAQAFCDFVFDTSAGKIEPFKIDEVEAMGEDFRIEIDEQEE